MRASKTLFCRPPLSQYWLLSETADTVMEKPQVIKSLWNTGTGAIEELHSCESCQNNLILQRGRRSETLREIIYWFSVLFDFGEKNNLDFYAIFFIGYFINQLTFDALLVFVINCLPVVLPGHPEGCGLLTLCGHRRPVPEAHGWHMESPEVFQQHSACSYGSRARGPQDWLVQPLCTSSFLRGHRGQLRSDADESHKDPQHVVQSKVTSSPSYFSTLWEVES